MIFLHRQSKENFFRGKIIKFKCQEPDQAGGCLNASCGRSIRYRMYYILLTVGGDEFFYSIFMLPRLGYMELIP